MIRSLYAFLPRSTVCAFVAMMLSMPVVAQTPPPAASNAPANAANTDNGDSVSLNFNAAEIDTVIRAIGKITGRNFLIDPRVKGTINIVTSRPVNKAMVSPILLSALRLQGFTAVEEGRLTKIVPEADAKLHAVPTGQHDAPATSGDRIVTEIFQIKHESATQLVQVVRPLVTPNNTVSVYPANNSLVVTDYADNVTRIRRIIESIDVPANDSQVIPVQNASAVDLATMVTKLINESGTTEPSQKVAIVADARTNSLLIRSSSPSRLQAVRSLIAQLDQTGSLGNLRVVYLKNGDAVKIAQTLRAISATDANTQNQQNQQQQQQAAARTSTGGQGNSGPSTFSANINGALIYADTSTNSIVINAPDALYNSLRGIIDQLDRRPAQIYVEALIAEVSAERTSEFGIQWNSATPNSGKTTVFGGTNFQSGGKNILALSVDPTTAATGMNLAIGGGAAGSILNMAMLARLLEQDANTNILSTPSLVTVDNEEAKIVVGRNVPFVTGSFTNSASGASNPFQTFERKDVGLTLKIKPQITEGGSVRLVINQEASSVLSTSATSGPVTSKRSLDSTVIVDDGAFLALGGLIEDSSTGTIEKVPLLGDIPFLGRLFRYDTRNRSKTNLVIFLRPVILRTAEDAANVTGSRYDYVIGRQQLMEKTDKPGLLQSQPSEPGLPPLLKLDPRLPVIQSPAATTPAVK
ncbi:type II secretion system secretin GspD [Viridibacterium curvum]